MFYDFDGRSNQFSKSNFQLKVAPLSMLTKEKQEKTLKINCDNLSYDKKNEENNSVDYENKINFRFGKQNNYSFCLDFTYPFSPLSAFSVALAAYDKKIN